jgi:hypothetical protein
MKQKMDINVKKTKVLVISEKVEETSNTVVNGTALEQVSKYKYLGNVITYDGRCEEGIKIRITMAKEAFWHNTNFSGQRRKESWHAKCFL